MSGDSLSSAVSRPSATTPTTSKRRPASPRSNSRPVASRPGHSVAAVRAEITAGVTAFVRSRSSNPRPCSTGSEIVSKYPGPTKR
jgi:hypothetical protein